MAIENNIGSRQKRYKKPLSDIMDLIRFEIVLCNGFDSIGEYTNVERLFYTQVAIKNLC